MAVTVGGFILALRERGFMAWAFGLAFVLCVINIVNNIFFQIPSIVIAYPLRVAQIMLFLFWVLAAKRIDEAWNRYGLARWKIFRWARIVACATLVIFGAANSGFPQNLTLRQKIFPQWAKICKSCQVYTDVRACIIVPPDKENFQYLSKRSAFMTFKSFPFKPIDAIEWFERLKLLGNIAIETPELGLLTRPVEVDTDKYATLKAEDFLLIAQRYPFVDYCITARSHVLPFPEVFQNSAFTLYRIPRPKQTHGGSYGHS
jgi:hypothetical protein